MPWTGKFSQPYAFLLNNALVNKVTILEIATILRFLMCNLTTGRDKIHKSIVIKVHNCCSPRHTSILYISLENKTKKSKINHGWW